MFFLRTVFFIFMLINTVLADDCDNNYALSLVTGEKFCVSGAVHINGDVLSEALFENDLTVKADDLFQLEVGDGIDTTEVTALPKVNIVLEEAFIELE